MLGASERDKHLNQEDQNKKAKESNHVHKRVFFVCFGVFFACFVGLVTSHVKIGVCKLNFVISRAELEHPQKQL